MKIFCSFLRNTCDYFIKAGNISTIQGVIKVSMTLKN